MELLDDGGLRELLQSLPAVVVKRPIKRPSQGDEQAAKTAVPAVAGDHGQPDDVIAISRQDPGQERTQLPRALFLDPDCLHTESKLGVGSPQAQADRGTKRHPVKKVHIDLDPIARSTSGRWASIASRSAAPM